jgi:hypothetical protein
MKTDERKKLKASGWKYVMPAPVPEDLYREFKARHLQQRKRGGDVLLWLVNEVVSGHVDDLIEGVKSPDDRGLALRYIGAELIPPDRHARFMSRLASLGVTRSSAFRRLIELYAAGKLK